MGVSKGAFRATARKTLGKEVKFLPTILTTAKLAHYV